MREPARLLHRFLALLLLLVVLAGAVLFVVFPVQKALSDMDAQIADDMRMIERLQAGGDSLEVYEEAIATLAAALQDDPRFLSDDSPALASPREPVSKPTASGALVIRRKLETEV